jgi:hypothetical protein
VTKTKIPGADLKPGDVFKHAAHGRIYVVVHLEDADFTGARYGDFRQSNGEIVCFNTFTDSTYELRRSAPSPRVRMVKVRADDIKTLLGEGIPDPVELEAAVQRLKAAIQ